MPRIYLSLAVILGSASLIAVGSTGAFFSDLEASTGNTFAAGTLDLKIYNDSYYNGNQCVNVTPPSDSVPVWEWQGTAAYPVPGTPCNTSFPLSDLDNGKLFFNFKDLKPEDHGEDTISLHVQNDAWACLKISLTSNDDVSSTEPELGNGDVQEDADNTWDGELAQNLQMFWWADDGDNVYEQSEPQVSPGIVTLYNLATTTPFTAALADSAGNIWGDQGPLPANQTKYIAKGWCFGTLGLDPVTAGQGVNPSINSGMTCNGKALNNLTQTDSVTLDVQFDAIQARNNPTYRCTDRHNQLGQIVVRKVVKNDNGGNNIVPDFHLFIDNGIVTTQMTSGATTTVSSGPYSVFETGVTGYVGTYGGDCDSEGNVVVPEGGTKVCTIINDDLPGNITLIKNVTGAPPLADPGSFKLRINGALVPNNTSIPVNSNTPNTITEDAKIGYHFVSITGNAKCPVVLGGTATLDEGEAITCTITNARNP